MNILFISPTQPIANGAGVQKRAWSHLEALSSAGIVDSVLLLSPGQIDRLQSLDEIGAHCRSMHIIPTDPTPRARNFGIPILTLIWRWLTRGKPISAPRLGSELSKLRAHVHSIQYDLVFCYRVRSFTAIQALFDKSLSGTPKIFVDFDDVDSIALQRELDARSTFIGMEQRLLMKLECTENKMYEMQALNKAHGVSVCSGLDAERLRQIGAKSRICVVPNSLPTQPILGLQPHTEKANFLFIGTMTYAPNEDAVIHFCNEILPIIKSRPQAGIELEIVGRNPSAAVRALAQDSAVKVTGGVESVEPFYERAHVVIAPIRFGGGTRIKILEALVFGRPVVSTTIGAEGLDLIPGRDILIADNPEAFAEACLQLANDYKLREQLAVSGRQRFDELYDTHRVHEKMLCDIREIIAINGATTNRQYEN